MDTDGSGGGLGDNRIAPQTQPHERRSYSGVDRGFIFFETEPGVPWRGLTEVQESDSDYRVETYYIDGKKIGHRHHAGNYAAEISSYDNPFTFDDLQHQEFGFSYREHYRIGETEHYRLHLIHGASIQKKSVLREVVNATETPSLYSWELVSRDVPLTDSISGSHLILDSSIVYEWILRDIETILYGYPDGGARIPSIEEIYEIFSTMNFVIIDHGDGTWSAVGHATMINMLDATEFQIVSPTANYIEDDTYEISSLIKDERWLQ